MTVSDHPTLALACELISRPSVTPAEAGALALIEGLLKAAAFEVHRVTFAEPGTAPVENLFARIGKAGPHLAFAGHTDVVPPGDEARWTHPPFAGDISDGNLYGRGAVDMKGAIACALAATLDHLAANGGRPSGSITFLITGDEEGIAVNGTVKLLQWAAERGENVDEARQRFITEYEDTLANPYIAAERGYIDTVITPSNTRMNVTKALRALRNKRETLPPKKHGNIPL